MGKAQRIIGLTGGIATGKSTVSTYLQQQYHIPVLDADDYARQAVEPGSPILTAVAQRFGSTMLQPDGSLDRSRLGGGGLQPSGGKDLVGTANSSLRAAVFC